MKRFFVFALVLALMFALCACSTGKMVVDGQEITVKNNETVVVASGDFTITRIDACSSRSQSMNVKYDYIVTAKSNSYTVVFIVDAEHYAKWDIGTVVSGTVTKSWDAAMERFDADIQCGEHKFTVQWCGEN